MRRAADVRTRTPEQTLALPVSGPTALHSTPGPRKISRLPIGGVSTPAPWQRDRTRSPATTRQAPRHKNYPPARDPKIQQPHELHPSSLAAQFLHKMFRNFCIRCFACEALQAADFYDCAVPLTYTMIRILSALQLPIQRVYSDASAQCALAPKWIRRGERTEQASVVASMMSQVNNADATVWMVHRSDEISGDIARHMHGGFHCKTG